MQKKKRKNALNKLISLLIPMPRITYNSGCELIHYLRKWGKFNG